MKMKLLLLLSTCIVSTASGIAAEQSQNPPQNPLMAECTIYTDTCFSGQANFLAQKVAVPDICQIPLTMMNPSSNDTTPFISMFQPLELGALTLSGIYDIANFASANLWVKVGNSILSETTVGITEVDQNALNIQLLETFEAFNILMLTFRMADIIHQPEIHAEYYAANTTKFKAVWANLTDQLDGTSAFAFAKHVNALVGSPSLREPTGGVLALSARATNGIIHLLETGTEVAEAGKEVAKEVVKEAGKDVIKLGKLATLTHSIASKTLSVIKFADSMLYPVTEAIATVALSMEMYYEPQAVQKKMHAAYAIAPTARHEFLPTYFSRFSLCSPLTFATRGLCLAGNAANKVLARRGRTILSRTGAISVLQATQTGAFSLFLVKNAVELGIAMPLTYAMSSESAALTANLITNAGFVVAGKATLPLVTLEMAWNGYWNWDSVKIGASDIYGHARRGAYRVYHAGAYTSEYLFTSRGDESLFMTRLNDWMREAP